MAKPGNLSEDDFTHYFNACIRLTAENTRLRAQVSELLKELRVFTEKSALEEERSSLVERLRVPVMYHRNAEQTNAERKEAAAEIERLQQEATKIANERAALAFENERLRAELEVISHATDPVWMARKASRALGKNEP